MFSTGSFVGNILMGCASDVVAIRSPIFEAGIAVSTAMMFMVALSNSPSYNYISALTFVLGGAITGSTIIIAAIECDMGVYVSQKYGNEALGTFSGMIDGFASLGSVVGQLIIAKFKGWYGWEGTMLVLAVFTGISGLPTLTYIKFEY